MPSMYAPLDLLKNELRQAAVQNLLSAPGSPVKGQLYYNSTGGDDTLYWYNGSGWVAAKGGAGAVPSTTVTTQAVGDAAVVGTSTNYAREDHKHGREAFGAITAQTAFGAASGNGSAVTVTRSDHTHGTPTHDDTAHAAIHLNALAAPTASVSLGSQKIINLADPTSGTDASTKQYVDNSIAGLNWKDVVRAASTVNVTIASPGATIDGVTMATNDRVLLKDQSTASQNGVWVWNGAAAAMTRATDADIEAELLNAAVFISEGTVNADRAYTMTTNAPIVVGTTALAWAQFGASTSYTAGNGLTLTGNSIDFVAGDSSLTVAADDVRVNTAIIATVASLTGYTATTRNLTAGAGLTGGGTLAADRTFDVVAGDTSITVAADNIIVNTAVIATVASVGLKADKTTTVTAGAGLTGGGDLSANRTFDVVAADTSLVVAADSITRGALTGDVTAAQGANATTISNSVVTNAKLANMPANTFKGIAGGPGVPTDLTQLQAKNLLGTFTLTEIGMVNASGGFPSNYLLAANGLWVAPSMQKYAAALTGTTSPETVTHNLNTRDIQLTVLNGATPYTAVEVDWDATTVNTAVVRFNPPLGAGYRVVVTG